MKERLALRSADDLLEAVRTARYAFVEAGFDITDRSETALTAEKGSPVATLAFGWLAGRHLWTIQYVDGYIAPNGAGIIELSRNLLDDALNEKYIGPPKLEAQFRASISHVTRALAEAHLLARRDSQQ
jgi:hypothetical protein